MAMIRLRVVIVGNGIAGSWLPKAAGAGAGRGPSPGGDLHAGALRVLFPDPLPESSHPG